MAGQVNGMDAGASQVPGCTVLITQGIGAWGIEEFILQALEHLLDGTSLAEAEGRGHSFPTARCRQVCLVHMDLRIGKPMQAGHVVFMGMAQDDQFGRVEQGPMLLELIGVSRAARVSVPLISTWLPSGYLPLRSPRNTDTRPNCRWSMPLVEPRWLPVIISGLALA